MKRRRTFTLVEILVMLAIIGLIAGLLLPNLHKKHQRALRKSASTEIRVIKHEVLTYHLDMKEFPASLNDLIKNPGSPPRPDGVVRVSMMANSRKTHGAAIINTSRRATTAAISTSSASAVTLRRALKAPMRISSGGT